MPGATATRPPFPRGRSWSWAAARAAAELAEELHESGREVFLACGRAPWLPRRPGGRDIVTWLKDTSFFDTPLSALPAPTARLGANLLVTGQRGGHDLHYRTLQAMGVQLLGRLTGVEGHRPASPTTWPTRLPSVMPATPTSAGCSTSNSPPGGPPRPSCPTRRPSTPTRRWSWTSTGSGGDLHLGFRPDYTDWVRFPAFDALGFPLADNGASTVVPGLYFCGVHFLRKRKSSVLFGVGRTPPSWPSRSPTTSHHTARQAPELAEHPRCKRC